MIFSAMASNAPAQSGTKYKEVDYALFSWTSWEEIPLSQAKS